MPKKKSTLYITNDQTDLAIHPQENAHPGPCEKIVAIECRVSATNRGWGCEGDVTAGHTVATHLAAGARPAPGEDTMGLTYSPFFQPLSRAAVAIACTVSALLASSAADAGFHRQGTRFKGAERTDDELQPGWLQWSARDFSALPRARAVGMHWIDTLCTRKQCRPIWYRIVSMAHDTSRNSMLGFADNLDIQLFELQYTLEDPSAPAPGQSLWHNPCGAGARGLFVAGRWRTDGSYIPGGSSFSCLGGAIGKCVRDFGYKPWKSLPTADGRSMTLAPLHRACVRAVRADYCGNGETHTRTGEEVEIFDIYDFNVRTHGLPLMPEAAFDEHGATWVQRVRVQTAARDNQTSRAPACLRGEPDTGFTRPLLLQVWSRPARD